MNIAQEIEQLRVMVPRRPNAPTVRRVERMIELYSTHSLKEVSEIMGCHLETVRYWLKKRGVEIRPQGKNIHERWGMKYRSHKIDCSAV
jgi:hypothetical protein